MMTLAEQAAQALAATGWDRYRVGDTDAAEAYWASARLVAAVFKEPTNGN